MALTSKCPYFLKAWYDWMVANNLTPYLIVNANYPGVCVPQDYVENGRITLDISPDMVKQLTFTLQKCEFNGHFGEEVGAFWVSIPMGAIVAIYENENKTGGFFEEEAPEKLLETDASSVKVSPLFKVLDSNTDDK